MSVRWQQPNGREKEVNNAGVQSKEKSNTNFFGVLAIVGTHWKLGRERRTEYERVGECAEGKHSKISENNERNNTE